MNTSSHKNVSVVGSWEHEMWHFPTCDVKGTLENASVTFYNQLTGASIGEIARPGSPPYKHENHFNH